MTTTDRTFVENPSVMYYGGPGNVTALDMNYDDTYVTIMNPKASFMVAINSVCQPDDGLPRFIETHNASYALPDNPDAVKGTLLNFSLNENLYRQIRVNVTQQNFINIENNPAPILLLYGDYNIDIFVTDFVFQNVSCLFPIAQVIAFRSVLMTNTIYREIGETFDQPAMIVQFVASFVVENILYENINGTASTQNPLMALQNLPTTNTMISGIQLVDSWLNNRKVIENLSSLQTLTIQNGVYSNSYQSTDGVLISTGTIGKIIFQNHTFTGMLSTESSDTTSVVLQISSIDLAYAQNSSIQDISISNSTIGFISYGGITGTGSDLKMDINNFSYFDSTIAVVKSLINTKNLLSDQDYTIIIDNATFTNIEFTTRGYLLDLYHQLPTELIVRNSNFNNLNSALLHIEAGNLQNDALSARVLIENTPFENINSEANSLININEGGILQVRGSTFTQCGTYEEGAIIYAGSQKSTTLFDNCTFTNNYAEFGA